MLYNSGLRYLLNIFPGNHCYPANATLFNELSNFEECNLSSNKQFDIIYTMRVKSSLAFVTKFSKILQIHFQ